MALFRDRYASNRARDAYAEEIGSMKSHGGRVTRSVSKELKAKPDKATQGLQKRAEKGDEAAKQELARRWKRDNH